MPSIVFINGWFPRAVHQIIRTCKKKGILVVTRGDSNLKMKYFPLKNLIKRIYLKPIFKDIDHFMEVGIRNHDFYSYMGVKEEQRTYAFHCIDTPFFEKQFAACDAAKEENVVIGFAGKLIEKKRPMDLLRAVANSEHRNRINIRIIGDGPLIVEMKKFALSKKLNVQFTGFLNQSEIVKKGYNGLDCLVLCSSYNETWGLVINEAMTGGIPVIVSDKVGAADDLVTEGVTGFIYKSRNVLDLMNKINILISRLDRNEGFRDEVLKRIEKYSLQNTVKGYLQALELLSHREQ